MAEISTDDSGVTMRRRGHVMAGLVGSKKTDPELYSFEVFWRDLHEFLKAHGYTLRPRYRPGWSPSWKQKGATLSESASEDGPGLRPGNLMDAVRDSDGTCVLVKILSPECFLEGDMALHFNAGSLGADPRNHIVPAYEVLEHPDDPDVRLLVMALLREIDEPPFQTIGEIIDCIQQLFEGIQFMHLNNTAHRDCCANNIRMEPSMMRDPFHWLETRRRHDWSGRARSVSRSKRPPKYYLIDLGISRTFESTQDARDYPMKGGDYTLPELAYPAVPSDPFAGDVYLIGNWAREVFLERYKGLDFLTPRIDDMTQTDPSARPQIDAAVARLDEIIQATDVFTLCAPARLREQSRLGSLVRTPVHCLRQAWFAFKGLPAIPERKPDAPFSAPKVRVTDKRSTSAAPIPAASTHATAAAAPVPSILSSPRPSSRP